MAKKKTTRLVKGDDVIETYVPSEIAQLKASGYAEEDAKSDTSDDDGKDSEKLDNPLF